MQIRCGSAGAVTIDSVMRRIGNWVLGQENVIVIKIFQSHDLKLTQTVDRR